MYKLLNYIINYYKGDIDKIEDFLDYAGNWTKNIRKEAETNED